MSVLRCLSEKPVMLYANNDVRCTFDVSRAVLASETLRFGRVSYAELSRKTQRVNGDEASIVISLNVFAEIYLHVGSIKPAELF